MFSISASDMVGNTFMGFLLYSLYRLVKYGFPVFKTAWLFRIQECNNFLSVIRVSTPANAGPVNFVFTAWQVAQLFRKSVLPTVGSCALVWKPKSNKIKRGRKEIGAFTF